MPEYRLSLDFTAADDAQAARLAEAWAGTCAAEYGTRYRGFDRLPALPEPDLSPAGLVLAEALRPLADILDPEEGPVILAYSVAALAYVLDDRLACLGFELTPTKGSYQPPTEGQT